MIEYRIPLWPFIWVALVWSYLVQPTLWPFAGHATAHVLCLAVAITGLSALYRQYQWRITLGRHDALVFTLYTVILGFVHSQDLAQSLGGDELYHSERAVFYLHGLKYLPSGAAWANAIRRHPVPEVNLVLTWFAMALAVAGWLIVRRFWIRERDWRFWRPATLLMISSGIGLAAAFFKVPPESHPPLRLLPLFGGQLFLGLQDISFRIPGILAMGALGWACWRFLRSVHRDNGFFAFAVSLALLFDPTVFHATAIVEPSLWAYLAAVGAILACLRAFRHRREEDLLLASVLIGLGSLMRQTTVILWPAFALVCFVGRPWIRRWALLITPILFIIPYGMTLSRIGHPMASVRVFERPSDVHVAPVQAGLKTESPGALDHVLDSVRSGIGLKTILKSYTFPWLLVLLAGMIVVFSDRTPAVGWFYLLLPLGYGLFYSLNPQMWGVGRYLAEFLAPCTAFTLLLWAGSLSNPSRVPFIVLLAALGGCGWFANRTLSQDVHYDFWSRRRLSTESTFPYREALGFLQRQESNGRFVIVGGVPVYGRMILWLRGFDAAAVENYSASEEALHALSGHLTLATFLEFAHRNDLNYFLVQYGDKRERQHESPDLAAFLRDLGRWREIGTRSSSGYVPLQTFIGSVEGAIDLYGKPSLRYEAT